MPFSSTTRRITWIVVAQATSQNQDVWTFFSDLNGITNFFSNCSQRVAVSDRVVGKRIPRVSATRWNFQSRTVNTVFEHREVLIECMEETPLTSKQPANTIKAGALAWLLHGTKFAFWLSVFHKLIPHVNVLYNQLQLTYADASRIKSKVANFITEIDKENMNVLTKQVTELHNKGSCKRSRLNEDFHVRRKTAAKDTCDMIKSQIQTRYLYFN